jgi:hypothetical protein
MATRQTPPVHRWQDFRDVETARRASVQIIRPAVVDLLASLRQGGDPEVRGDSSRGICMQYMILIYGDERNFATLANDAEAQKQMYAAYTRYGASMREAGVLRGGAELKPTHSATTVRIKNGKPVTTDGPFAETKEQLGGYYLIDVPNLDEAVRWAAQCPAANGGSVEVRPLGMSSSAA